MYLQCVIFGEISLGNFEPGEAESVVIHIEELLFGGHNAISKPIFSSQHLTNRVLKLEKGVNFSYPVMVLNKTDENSSLVRYIQVIYRSITFLQII